MNDRGTHVRLNVKKSKSSSGVDFSSWSCFENPILFPFLPFTHRCVTITVTMSIRRLLVVARKEFRHIIRDPRILSLVTVAPAFLLIALSYVFAMDIAPYSSNSELISDFAISLKNVRIT